MICCGVVLRKAHRQQDVFLCGGESAMSCAESGKPKMPIAATMAMMHRLARVSEISPGNTSVLLVPTQQVFGPKENKVSWSSMKKYR